MILDVPQFERPLSLTERGRDELRRGRIISLARAREIAMGILADVGRRESDERGQMQQHDDCDDDALNLHRVVDLLRVPLIHILGRRFQATVLDPH